MSKTDSVLRYCAVSEANTNCLSDVLDYWSNNGYRVVSLSDILLNGENDI